MNSAALFKFRATRHNGQLTFRPEQLRLWDVDTPNLYDVTLELVAEDTVIDRIFTYFGMRKVSIAKAPWRRLPIYLP